MRRLLNKSTTIIGVRSSVITTNCALSGSQSLYFIEVFIVFQEFRVFDSEMIVLHMAFSLTTKDRLEMQSEMIFLRQE